MSEEIIYYTPDLAGSGQYGKCVNCKRSPSKEGHDGCMGKLQDKWVMNACCGHGIGERAYVQFWNQPKKIGPDAVDFIELNKNPEEG